MVSVTTPYLKDINLPLVISCLCSCLQELDCHISPAKYSVESFCLFPQVRICSWWKRRRKTCGESFVALEILQERWSTKKTWEPLVPTPSHYMSRVFLKTGTTGRPNATLAYRKSRCIYAVLANKITRCIFLCSCVFISGFGRDLNPIRDG